MQPSTNQLQPAGSNVGIIVAAIIVGLIIGGGVTLWVIYPTTDRTTFYIVAAVMILSPTFVLAAFLINKKMQTPVYSAGPGRASSYRYIDSMEV
jgi:hypothetical protein